MTTRNTLLVVLGILVIIFAAILYHSHDAGIIPAPAPTSTTTTSAVTQTVQPVKTTQPQKSITLSYQLGDGAQISAATDVDITGWQLKSAATGKSYTIPSITIEDGYKGTEQKTVPAEHVTLYQYDYTTVLIADGGDPKENYVHRTESTSYYLYTGSNFTFAKSDTLSLVDPSGAVRASTTY